MAGFMYFATKAKGAWLPCPSVSMPSPKVGFAGQTNFLNGGAYVRRSKAAHKEYDITWNMQPRDAIRPVMDIADGLWGDGLVYFLDPLAYDRNMLPQAWASPFQGAYDGIPLNGGARPTLVATPANTNDYPAESAVYTVSSAVTNKPTTWLPIPPGYTAWVGVHGSLGTGGYVQVRPTTGQTTYGPTSQVTPISVDSTTRFNVSFDGSQYNGIELSLGGDGTVTLSGLMVQIVPTVAGSTSTVLVPSATTVPSSTTTPGYSTPTATMPEGGFISGQGNSGCQFAEQPAYTPYSAALDRVGLSVRLVETGMWQ